MSRQRDPVLAVRKPSPPCCRGQHSWETHPAAHLCKKPGDFKARSLHRRRWHRTAAPASPGSVTALARGEKETFQLTQPSSNGEKRKGQNPGALLLLAKQALLKLPEDLWHFKVFPFSRALLQD